MRLGFMLPCSEGILGIRRLRYVMNLYLLGTSDLTSTISNADRAHPQPST